MPPKTTSLEACRTIGIDIGKNTFHLIGLDKMGAIVLRQKLSRNQVDIRLANMPRCLIGMEACVGAHHLSRQLKALGHDARLMPARYVRPYSKGQKNDFRDAEAIAEAAAWARLGSARPRVRPAGSACVGCGPSTALTVRCGNRMCAPISGATGVPRQRRCLGSIRCR